LVMVNAVATAGSVRRRLCGRRPGDVTRSGAPASRCPWITGYSSIAARNCPREARNPSSGRVADHSPSRQGNASAEIYRLTGLGAYVRTPAWRKSPFRYRWKYQGRCLDEFIPTRGCRSASEEPSLIKPYEIYAAVLLSTLFVFVFRDRAGIAKTGRHEARSIHTMNRQPRDH